MKARIRYINVLKFFMVFSLVVGLITTTNGNRVAAASKWNWSQISGKESSTLNDVFVFNSGIKVAVGNDSAILRSELEGSWSTVEWPSKGNWNTAAVDGSGMTGVIANDHGQIARSTDGLHWSNGLLQGAIRLDEMNLSWKNKPEGGYKLINDQIVWSDITWSDNQFVAVGTSSIIKGSNKYYGMITASSSDGQVWKLHPLGTNAKLSPHTESNAFQVIRFQNKWIIMTSEGLFSSIDLKNWTYKEHHIIGDFYGLETNGTSLITVGWYGHSGTRSLGGIIYRTTDLINWTEVYDTDVSMHTVIWDGERYVAGGRSGAVAESKDGITWTNRTQDGGSFNSPFFSVKYMGLKGDINKIAKTSNSFIAVGAAGAIRTSTDLSKPWILETSGQNASLKNIAYAGGIYAISGDGTFKTSTDIKTWMNAGQDWINDDMIIFHLAADNDMFFIQSIDLYDSKIEGLIYQNGLFTDVTKSVPGKIDEIIIVNHELRIYDQDGNAVSSKDGKQWTKLTGLQPIPVPSNERLWIGADNYNTYTSVNGVNWTKPSMLLDGKKPMYWSFEQVVWTGNYYVAINSGTLIRSIDGKNWTTVYKSKGSHSLAVSGKGEIAVVGSKGLMLTSTDGNTWSVAAPVTTKDLNDVIWDGNQFVAVGDEGVIITGRK